MRHTLRGSSTCDIYMVFDPAAMSVRPWADESPEATRLREVARGNAILYARPRRTPPGRLAIIRVYVEEEPEQAILIRGGRRGTGFLSVPEGTLVASGVSRRTRRFMAGETSEVAAQVPAGDYAVEAFPVDWSDADDGGTSPRPPRITTRAIDEGLRWAVFLSMLTVVVLSISGHGRPIVIGFARVAWWALLAAVSLMIVGPNLRRIPPLARFDRRIRAAEDEFPEACIVLKRFPPGTRTASLRGCRFGAQTDAPRGFEVTVPDSTSAG